MFGSCRYIVCDGYRSEVGKKVESFFWSVNEQFEALSQEGAGTGRDTFASTDPDDPCSATDPDAPLAEPTLHNQKAAAAGERDINAIVSMEVLSRATEFIDYMKRSNDRYSFLGYFRVSSF